MNEQRPPTSDTTPRTAAAAPQPVMTPSGPGVIVNTLYNNGWMFGRARRTVTHIVEYPNGHRHAWVSDKVKHV